MSDENLSSDYEAQLKAANEAVYKQSSELAIKNKTLALLGKLYEISVLSLAPSEQAERVTKTIQQEFDFGIVSLLRYNAPADTLETLAVATSQKVHDVESNTGEMLAAAQFDKASQRAFFKPIIVEHTMHYVNGIKEVWCEEHLQLICESLVANDTIHTTIGYPLVVDERVIGVLLLGLNRAYEDLGQYEQDAIRSFIIVIAVTLDKVMLYEQLGIANRQQEGLIHFISHEVKGALGKSSGTLSMILEGDYGATTPALIPVLEHAVADTRQATEMISTILLSANIKTGKMNFDMQPLSLKEIVSEIVDSHQQQAALKELALSFIATANGNISGDRNMLSTHVIRNLLENAIHYTPAGSIEVKLDETDTHAMITITDTGIGLSDDDKKVLFTEGGRGKDSIKVNVNSTGFGLFFAKELIEAHKGAISAESAGRGKGSTFTITLPKA